MYLWLYVTYPLGCIIFFFLQISSCCSGQCMHVKFFMLMKNASPKAHFVIIIYRNLKCQTSKFPRSNLWLIFGHTMRNYSKVDFQHVPTTLMYENRFHHCNLRTFHTILNISYHKKKHLLFNCGSCMG